jgi:hypothetical protein
LFSKALAPASGEKGRKRGSDPFFQADLAEKPVRLYNISFVKGGWDEPFVEKRAVFR